MRVAFYDCDPSAAPPGMIDPAHTFESPAAAYKALDDEEAEGVDLTVSRGALERALAAPGKLAPFFLGSHGAFAYKALPIE